MYLCSPPSPVVVSIHYFAKKIKTPVKDPVLLRNHVYDATSHKNPSQIPANRLKKPRKKPYGGAVQLDLCYSQLGEVSCLEKKRTPL